MANGVLVAGSTNGKGPIYAMNAKTGKVMWSYDTGGTVYGGMLVSNGCIYIGNGYIVNTKQAAQNWPNHGGDSYNRRYANKEKKISPKTMSKLHLKWKFYAGDDISVTPAIFNDTIYFPSWNGNLYAVKASDVSFVWKKNLQKLTGFVLNVNSTVSRSTPTIAGELLLVGLFGPAVVIASKRSNENLMWSTRLDDHARGFITVFEAYYKELEARPGGLGGGAMWGAATDERRIYTNIANSQRKNFTLKPSKNTTIAGGWVAMDARNGNQRNTKYIPVQSTVSIVEEYPEKPEVGVKAEEQSQSSSSGTRKKVTFDSNVRTYEHVLTEHVSGTLPEKDEVGTKEEESLGKSGYFQPSSEASSITSSSRSYPPNHRYQNCRECDDDEDDEIDYEESDLDDEDDDGVLDYDDMYEEDGIVESKIAVAKEEIEEAVKPIRVNGSARDRSAYIHSVRNPVENLDQWKALKTKGKLQQNCRECDDEEDEIDYEDSDLDDEDDDGLLDYDDMYEEDRIIESKIAVAKEEIEEVVKPIRVNGSARDRSAYIHSVRNPVENLTQWKALKLKGKPQLKQQNCREFCFG
ncbi:hypothetical protein LWI28_008683 [Acer negundo]|uniref:Pyrrolo-quinoline quinone repeat domain-containing protein n=1 Tax=Acer negundo TaxID=4023 RepID=A0AAD5NEI3_ACENE|nr:hypothetical protein LWI28_008683 [Acer negundo]